MSRQLFALCLIAVACATGAQASCKATLSSFSTQDATILTQVAHVAEITLQCSNAAQTSLFAEFPCGKVVPVAQVGDNKYQVSAQNNKKTQIRPQLNRSSALLRS